MATAEKTPVLSSPVLGMVLFVLAEIMVFAAFISAFIIVKSNFTNWPPMGQPRLPVWATAFNSVFLLASAWFIAKTCHLFVAKKTDPLVKPFFLVSIVLGLLFVLLQGREWFHLLRFGLTMTSSVYGSFFYVIIGFHALHVLGAVVALTLMYTRLLKGTLQNESLKAIRVFWFFVVALWPILYTLVYL